MIKERVTYCDCCGKMIDQPGEYCPLCHYPIDPEKEKRFLRSEIDNLQRVVRYGGTNLRVSDLIARYQYRLNTLQQQAVAVSASVPVAPHIAVAPQPVVAPAAAQAEAPRLIKAPLPVTQVSPPTPRRVFSWKAFFADQAINIVASLGAFLILIGALGFTATTSNLLLAFVIVFAVHAVFGVTGFVTYRFASFRVVATIYTVIYALLIPLVGFSAYQLIAGNYIELSVPVLIAIAAAYAAIVYTILAIYQRFKMFAYLGIAALAVVDMAIADALGLSYWWWPSMLMILTLAALVSLWQSKETNWLFAGKRVVLREPIHTFLYVFAGICALSILAIAGYSFMLDASGMQHTEVRFSILSLILLGLLWSSLFLWLTRRTRYVIGLAFLFLAAVLALCYALAFEAIGYALALMAVALLYHGLSRFAPRLLQPFGTLERDLDWIALGLVFLVPWISSPLLPLQLVESAYTLGLSEIYQPDWQTIAELIALAAGLVLTLSVTFKRASFQRTPTRPAWCWLLLLGGFLLDFAYSLVIISLNLTPAWYLLGLTLALIVGAVIVRQRVGTTWANPLDILVLVNIALTPGLSGNLSQDAISALLLFFAAATYSILLYQRRQNWLFVSLIFALLALPTLLSRTEVLLVASVALPLAAIVVHRLVTEKWSEPHAKQLASIQLADIWEWPLLAAGLIYGITLAVYDITSSSSTVQLWMGIPCPVALELTLLALVWYGSAALARVKVWLLPAAGFAIAAALLPDNAFWVLVGLAPVLAILAVPINRVFGREWALPLYITALLCGVMVGYTGFTQDHLGAAAWALLAFAVLAYGIGAVEDQLLPMWVAPFFASWSMIVSAGYLDNLYQPPIVAIAAAALGVAISFFKLIPIFLIGAGRKQSFIAYALPLYATALIGAVLTGISGSLSDINKPFYGAVPDALLIYGVVAFAVLFYEKRPGWLWLVAGLAAWGAVLAVQLTPYYVPLIGAGAAVAGVLVGQLIKPAPVKTAGIALIENRRQFTWSWPWYLLALLAALLTGARTALPVEQASGNFIAYSLLAFTAIALGIMLLERLPELLVFPVGLATWSIWLWYPHLEVAPLMIAYSGLCILVFASQIIWRVIPPVKYLLPVGSLHDLLGLGGQTMVVLVIALQGGLFADAGMLVHVGAGSLFALAGLVFAYGWLRTHRVMPLITTERNGATTAIRLERTRTIQRWCYYSAGLLLSLVVSWELSAFRQTRLDVLLLAPASYLLVAAPFLMRDKILPAHEKVGQGAAALGASLLLLPALWFSFSDSNLPPTLILVGESLVLLALGILTRMRTFILSSAALVVAGTLRALFLTTSPSLALMLLGGVLLAIATALILARRQLKVAWKQWE
ncbi:MAG TPA: hypothetical protein VNG51_29330 [Ktedonobacteraceae bacterium]|nr:hypothetical protein [Ktedonobacteraceae bacterium]